MKSVVIFILFFMSSCITNTKGVSTETQTSNFIFAERDGVPLTADWHPAQYPTKREKTNPACIVVHGGGWYKGDKKDMQSVSVRLAEAGISVLNINYRLSPKYRFPASIFDVKDAIRWMKANAQHLGVDANSICLFGYSAGAHLSLMAGFTRTSDGLDGDVKATKIFSFKDQALLLTQVPTDLSVKAIVAGGTPSDLTGGQYNEYYQKYFGKPESEIPEVYKMASPIQYVKSGIPPIYLYHGEKDWVVSVDQSRRLVDKIKQVGGYVEYLEVYFGHVVTFLMDGKEIDQAITFLKSKLS